MKVFNWEIHGIAVVDADGRGSMELEIVHAETFVEAFYRERCIMYMILLHIMTPRTKAKSLIIRDINVT